MGTIKKVLASDPRSQVDLPKGLFVSLCIAPQGHSPPGYGLELLHVLALFLFETMGISPRNSKIAAKIFLVGELIITQNGMGRNEY